MNLTLKKILRKVESVQIGLLRVDDKNEKMLLHARAGSDQELLNCIVTKPGEEKEYQFRNVSLIQKDKHDYLYITCKVREQTHNNKAVIMSMEVIKACWFTRRSRGSVTWLQQKYSYETAS